MTGIFRALAAFALALCTVGCEETAPDLPTLIKNGDTRACDASVALLESDIRSTGWDGQRRYRKDGDEFLEELISVAIRNPAFIRSDPERPMVQCRADVAVTWTAGDHPFNDNVVWDEHTVYNLGMREGVPVVNWEATSHVGWGFAGGRYAAMAEQAHAAILAGVSPAPASRTDRSPAAIANDVASKKGSGEERVARPAQTISSPASGTAERREIMDAVRPVVVAQVGPPVEFVVNDIRVVGRYAFVVVEPQRPGGGRIDYSHLDDGLMDGLRTEAILVNRDGRWLVAQYGTGATDVWYLGFCGDYPRGLIPGC